jgi:hypothetical protein
MMMMIKLQLLPIALLAAVYVHTHTVATVQAFATVPQYQHHYHSLKSAITITSTSRSLLVKQQRTPSSTTNTKTKLAAEAEASNLNINLESLTPIEKWCVLHMDLWYSKSLRIKCPFFKRRTADLLDGVDMVMRFVVIRHKSLDVIGPPPGCRSTTMSRNKHKGLDTTQISTIIQQDWRQDTDKGYYITGRLNTTIYRDDCLFDGPDPDMPVKGLRKYLNAISHLFDHATSTAELQDLVVVDDTTIQARWKIQGVLHLPWHPKLPEWTGTTTYHLDQQGLVYLHEETWDMSVWQAFTQTLLPQVADKIWNTQEQQQAPPRSIPVQQQQPNPPSR